MIEEFISHVVVQGKASPGSVTPIESALSFDSSRANVKTHKALLLERVTEELERKLLGRSTYMGAISMPQGRGNRQHNIRGYGEGKMPKNINKNRMCENIILRDETIGSAYHRIFDEAVEEYNAKQKRKDRKIKNYYQHILNSKNGEKLFYEDVLQWGKMEDFERNPELREVAKECLIEYIHGSQIDGIPSFAERNLELELIGAYIHMDEASPHMHFDYIPVASGYTQGLLKRNGLDRAMKSLVERRTGKPYTPRRNLVDDMGKCKDNATRQWKDMERLVFRKICEKHKLVVDEEIHTPERDSLPVLEYKKQKREEELEMLRLKNEKAKETTRSEAQKAKRAIKAYNDIVNGYVTEDGKIQPSINDMRQEIYEMQLYPRKVLESEEGQKMIEEAKDEIVERVQDEFANKIIKRIERRLLDQLKMFLVEPVCEVINDVLAKYGHRCGLDITESSEAKNRIEEAVDRVGQVLDIGRNIEYESDIELPCKEEIYTEINRVRGKRFS